MSLRKATGPDDRLSPEAEIEQLKERIQELEKKLGEPGRNHQAAFGMLALESLRDGVFLIRHDSMFEYVNEAACRSLEYSRDELSGMGVGAIDPSYRPERWGPHWESLRQKGFICKETTQRTKSGRLIPVEVMATFICIDGVEMSCSVVREISERRRVEECLRECEARFRSLFLNIADGAALHRILHDERGVAVNYEILDLNPKCEEILGINRDDVLHKTASEVFRTVDPPYLTEFSCVANSGVPYAFEKYFAPLDKHFQILVVSSGKGFFSTIVFDVSPQKMREADLRRQQEAFLQPLCKLNAPRFEDCFELSEVQTIQDALSVTTGVSVVLIRPDGTLLSSSSFAKPSVGSTPFLESPANFLAGTVWESKNRLPSPSLKDTVFRAELKGEPGDAVVGFWLEERLLATWLIGACLSDSAGLDERTKRFKEIGGLFFMIAQWLSRTVFQNRQTSEMMLKLEKDEKNLSSQNAQLMSQNVELENALSVVSHDLKSPLVNIFGYTEQIRKIAEEAVALSQALHLSTEDSSRLREVFEERISRSAAFIHSGALKMDSLINGLLTFSRLGQVWISIEKLQTHKLIDRILQVMAFSIKSAGAVVVVDPLPDCYADAVQLNQVFSNLISNSLKYHHSDRVPRIRVFGRVEGSMTMFGVEDNGIGIKPEHQTLVWELFHRLNPSDEAGGEGMGLTLVRRIVERHHGRVFIESDGTNGTTVLFMIPNAREIANG